MADRVIREHEVVLNNIRFPLEGFIQESLISRFPPKQITGDYSFANENIMSNWIISDQRGGCLVEEMDEATQANRYWYGTGDTRFRNNLTLNPLTSTVAVTFTVGYKMAGTVTADSAVWTSTIQEGWWPSGTVDYKQYVAANTAWSDYLTFTHRSITATKLRYYVTSSSTAHYSDEIDAYYNAAWNNVTSSTTAITWGAFTDVNLGGSYNVTGLRVRAKATTGGVAQNFNVHGLETYGTWQAASTTRHFIEYNSNLYGDDGNVLIKLDGAGTAFNELAHFPSNVTQLVQNGSSMFVLLGDADAYQYCGTAETFSRTSGTTGFNATFGIWWNDRLQIFDSAGSCKYTATPAQADPAMVANGKLPIADNELQKVFTYFDAAGDDIIYASTKVGLFAHDTANAKFLQTALKVPPHPTAGKGAIVWHDAAYISAGLSVNKYVAASQASIDSMGLDQEDGLPQLRSGEIVKFIEGFNEFFALVDSTYEGTGSRSQVMSYDGRGWRTWWEATANNKNMYGGGVSSVYAYRLWFSTTDGIYYIPLQRTSLNPKKITGYNYAASGMHITPRFDGGTKIFPKVATKMTLFLADASSTETVKVYYQLDASTAGQLATTVGWTNIASLTANGVKEIVLGSSAGISFQDIQYRLDLARASGTTTLSPNIKGMVLSYYKSTDKKKAWSFTINTNEAGIVSSSPKVLIDALNTIIATNTLIAFTFRDGANTVDTHYVLIEPYSGAIPSGPNYEGTFNLTCVEV